MMNFPPIPTDNLYKFMALGGIALVFLSMWLMFARLKDAEIKTSEMGVELAVTRQKARNLLYETTLLHSPGRHRLLGLVANAQQIKIETAKESAQLKARKVLQADMDGELFMTYSFSAAGILMAILGFVLWYIRVQKPLDAMLKEQCAARH